MKRTEAELRAAIEAAAREANEYRELIHVRTAAADAVKDDPETRHELVAMLNDARKRFRAAWEREGALIDELCDRFPLNAEKETEK